MYPVLHLRDDEHLHRTPEGSLPMIVDPVPEDEVFDRLRASLEKDGIALRRGTLDGMSDDPRGRFYTTPTGSEEVSEPRVDLDRMARQKGVLKPNEALVPSKGEVT
jgi:hypothetical protein